MARIITVQHARKTQGQCGRCRDPIESGDPYRWTKRRYGPRLVRCMKATCSFRASEMTGSSHLQAIYGAQEDWREIWSRYSAGDIGIDGLASDLESAGAVIREEGESYQESADAQGEHFPGSEQVETAEENARACEETADKVDEFVEKLQAVTEALEEAEGILDELEVN